MTRWEYGELGFTYDGASKQVWVSWSGPDGTWTKQGADWVGQLNELGKNGWEAVGITSDLTSSHAAIVSSYRSCLMKRVGG